MFKIRMLPAGYGDCLWIEYGSAKKPNRLLIDAGTLPAYKDLRKRIENDLGQQEREFELFIVSHIDTDHIDAAVRLLNSPSLKLKLGQIWFNGWNQLVDKDMLGPQQGEYLSALIAQQGASHNTSFKKRAVMIPASGRLPVCVLPGGMKLTILSPGAVQLLALRSEWKKTMGTAAGDAKAALKKLAAQKKYKDVLGGKRIDDVEALADSKTKTDESPPNGSSIAVLAEYGGKRCLFAADAHPDIIESSVDRILKASGSDRLKLDALKVAHHGSKYNNTASLLKKINCRKYLVSTNGKIFHHPDPEGIARIIKYGGPNPEIHFNYDTDLTRRWDDSALKRKYRYQTFIRPDTDPALDVQL